MVYLIRPCISLTDWGPVQEHRSLREGCSARAGRAANHQSPQFCARNGGAQSRPAPPQKSRKAKTHLGQCQRMSQNRLLTVTGSANGKADFGSQSHCSACQGQGKGTPRGAFRASQELLGLPLQWSSLTVCGPWGAVLREEATLSSGRCRAADVFSIQSPLNGRFDTLGRACPEGVAPFPVAGELSQ